MQILYWIFKSSFMRCYLCTQIRKGSDVWRVEEVMGAVGAAPPAI